MALDLLKTKGTPLERQRFTLKELVQPPYSKLDDDAFTRVRVLLMGAIEAEACLFSHACARMNASLQRQLAEVRRVEQHQQTIVTWLNPADQSPLETTLGYEQMSVEIIAAVAQHEADPYLARIYRFGLLEEVDHIYRYAALYDRLEGKDANTILQSYTDILPGRPTPVEHRIPVDNLRRPYDRGTARPSTKLHALTVAAAEQQAHDYYMTVGPKLADPLARQLYAEIASIEEQHVTQYESLIDPTESWLEKWLLHEANEVYNYWSCVEYERNPRIRKIWERFLDYELGHLAAARAAFEQLERRDAAEILPAQLPEPIRYESQRNFVRTVLASEVELRAHGSEIVAKGELSPKDPSTVYAKALAADGSPAEIVAAGWVWSPGTELAVVDQPGTEREARTERSFQ